MPAPPPPPVRLSRAQAHAAQPVSRRCACDCVQATHRGLCHGVTMLHGDTTLAGGYHVGGHVCSHPPRLLPPLPAADARAELLEYAQEVRSGIASRTGGDSVSGRPHARPHTHALHTHAQTQHAHASTHTHTRSTRKHARTHARADTYTQQRTHPRARAFGHSGLRSI